MRLAPLLFLVPLTACIDRTPTADDDPPRACTPEDCGQSPDIVGCPDGSGPAVTCEAEDGVCAWQIGECSPDPQPEPVAECMPVDCGPHNDSPQCPPGTQPTYECSDDNGDGVCSWLMLGCEGAQACPPEACGPVPDGGGCPPNSEAVYECVSGVDACGWQVECVLIEPQGCSAEDCGPPPPGEPCGPEERSTQECRETQRGCEWYFACEAVDCAPSDCPPDPPQPNCEHTMECVPMGGACDWLIECVAPVCEQPWDAGSCLALQPVWWFNSETFECEPRDYGGCEGNDNRFETEEACYQACGVLGGEAPDAP